jgi:ubiquinone/menaquinone biosynthesis C-methylase UbiE/uncharacterized protein YbaR (Trm112 family)
MDSRKRIVEFNRSKIYEVMAYQPEPPGYTSEVPWIVQQQIAATNGRHYIDRIGRLAEYPIYRLPVPPVKGNKLMLDIGCGWGRWLVAGSNAGYTPIGIDIRLEFCKTARGVLADLKKTGYTVVADLENIPFRNDVFDLVWSFSVIQHTHIDRLKNCLFHINRILASEGYSVLEFPNKDGIRNRFGVAQDSSQNDDYTSWNVRYYSPNDYKSIFAEFLDGFEYKNHSFLGIGVLPEDLKYVSLRNKLICAVSLLASSITGIFPFLARYSDSIYIRAVKQAAEVAKHNHSAVSEFFALHQKYPGDNLNLLPLLQCPLTGQPLSLSNHRDKLINEKDGFFYPVVDNIPVLIVDERQGI